MSRFYVPWHERKAPAFRGPAQHVARLAIHTHRVASPIIKRIPGLLMLAGVFVVGIGCWIVALALRSVHAVHAYLITAGQLDPGQLASYAQVQEAVGPSGAVMPAGLVWALQPLIVRDLIGVGALVGFAGLLALFAIWWERKVSAFMQSRLGPMRVGGWHGWSQSLADGIKLLAKEDLIPDEADRLLFRLAPYLAFVPALTALIAVPFGVFWVFRDLDIALLLILALLNVEVLGVLIAGWASNNKWSVYGAMREACQVVSYEIPLGMSLLVPVMVAGSLRLTDFGGVQAGGWFNWLAFRSPWAFIALFTFFIAALASCKRAPFDLPEAESELVAGFHTEYSGFRWSVFFFAEYVAMFIVSALAAILFLGAFDAPWAMNTAFFVQWRASESLLAQLAYGVLVSGPVWLLLKAMLLIYVQMWLRWTLPRLRIDQVLYSCVQVMLPLVMVVLLASTLWELALDGSAAFAAVNRVITFVLGTIGLAALVGILLVAIGGTRRGAQLVGTQAVLRPLAGG